MYRQGSNATDNETRRDTALRLLQSILNEQPTSRPTKHQEDDDTESADNIADTEFDRQVDDLTQLLGESDDVDTESEDSSEELGSRVEPHITGYFGEDGLFHHPEWDAHALASLSGSDTRDDDPKGTPKAGAEWWQWTQEKQALEAEKSDSPQDASARFMFYSQVTGVHRAQTLNALRSGSLSFADLVEAASGQKTRKNQAPSGWFWLDVASPSDSEMTSLARAFGMHPLTAEDIMTDSRERDKFEAHGEYTFVVYRALDTDALDADGALEVSMVVKRNCIITVHGSHLGAVENALSRIQGLGEPASPAYVAYALIDDITDALGPVMRAIELEVDAIDELVLELSQREQSDMLKRIGRARRRILAMWRLLQGKSEVVRAFTRLMERGDEATAASEDVCHYLADVYDHLVAMFSACSHSDVMLARAHSNYMAHISLELGEAGVGISTFANRWLVVASVLLPIQFVTGLFGMNVPVPNNESEVNTAVWPWFVILGSCIAFVVVAAVWAKVKGVF